MKRRWRALLLLALLGPSCGRSGGGGAVPLVFVPAVGVPDATFGGGTVLTSIGPAGASGEQGYALARQADGKLVVAGYTTSGGSDNYALFRYSAAGYLDPTFDSDGIAVPVLAGNERAYAVVVQPDGKLVVAGTRAEVVARYNPDGSPDLTFDGDGYVALTNFQLPNTPRCLALQPDGKILVCGSSYNGLNLDFAVARLNPNGSLDTSLDGDGYAQVPMSAFSDDIARAIAVQPDGKIVVAGRTQAGTVDFVLLRLNPDGSPDTTFDGDGKVTTAVGASVDDLYSMVLQPDGKIVVTGAVYTGIDYGVGVVRYNPDGSLDTTFSGDGKVVTDVILGSDYPYDLAVQADGAIVMVGQAGDIFGPAMVIRYLPDGTLDPAFGSGGIRLLRISNAGDDLRSVLVQPDGQIVATGTSLGNVLLVRLRADGSVDSSFGAAGRAGVPGSSSTTTGYAVAVQPDGKIVVAGSTFNGSVSLVLVARFTAAGVIDTGFGSGGTVTTLFGPGGCGAAAVAVQPDGKIVVAGWTNNGTDQDFLVLRYLSSGALDPTFDGDGIVVTTFGSSFESAAAVAVLPSGKILVAGYAITGSDSDFAVARYDPNGALDPTFDGDGKVTTHLGFGWDYGTSLALYPDGRFLVAGYGDNATVKDDFAVVRYMPDGSLDPTFDGDGILRIPIGTDNDHAHSVAIQTDGRIVLSGSTRTIPGDNLAVVRCMPDGALDPSFDGDGKFTVNLGSAAEAGYSVAVQPDGAIVIAGDLTAAADFGVVRLTSTGSLDVTFDGDGLVTTDFSGLVDVARAMVLLPDGGILVAGTADSNRAMAIVLYR